LDQLIGGNQVRDDRRVRWAEQRLSRAVHGREYHEVPQLHHAADRQRTHGTDGQEAHSVSIHQRHVTEFECNWRRMNLHLHLQLRNVLRVDTPTHSEKV
jgi:hypothetical protein